MAPLRESIRSTHEDLMRFILGDDYQEYLEGPRGKREKQVVHHVRRRSTFQTALVVVAMAFVAMALTMTLYPRSVFYLGMVPTPTPLAAKGSSQESTVSVEASGTTLSVAGSTEVEWANGDFRQKLPYHLENLGGTTIYPTVVVTLLDPKGAVLDRLPFGVPKSGLAPGETADGIFYWERGVAGGKAGSYAVALQVGTLPGSGTAGTATDASATPAVTP